MYYKSKKLLDKPLIIDKYNEVLNQCYLNYLQGIRDKDTADVQRLSKIFAKKWSKKELRNNYTSLDIERWNYQPLKETGAKTLVLFHNLIRNTIQCPICMFKTYACNIHNIQVNGTFDYIREATIEGKSEIQLIKINNMLSQTSTIFAINENIELTAMIYAFNQIFDCESYKTIYIDVPNNKTYDIHRTQEDIKIFENTVINVYNSIINNIYTYSPSDKCYKCPFKGCCKDNFKKEISLC